MDNTQLNKAEFCFFVNMRYLLAHYGIHVDIDSLAVLLSYMGFQFASESSVLECITGRNGTISDLYGRFKEAFNGRFVIQRHTMDAVTNVLSYVLAQGYIPVVFVDDYYLEHTAYNGKEHYMDLLLVVSVQEDYITLFDNGLHNVSIDVFKSALRDSQLHLEYTESLLLDDARVYDACIKGLAGSIACMRMGRADAGLSGMESFRRYLAGCCEPDRFYQFYYALNRPCGLAHTRLSMHRFLIAAAINLPSYMTKAAAWYGELAHGWRLAANLIFKLSRFYDIALRDRIAERIAELQAMEAEGLRLLTEVISCEVNVRRF